MFEPPSHRGTEQATPEHSEGDAAGMISELAAFSSWLCDSVVIQFPSICREKAQNAQKRRAA
jgi:hypothetical protein